MKCERCNGLGYTSEHDPDDPHKGGVCTSCPIAVQCEQCMGSGENLECKAEITAAVAAERRRVWDIVSARMRQSWWNADRLDTLNMLTNELFPDGDPQTTKTAGPSPVELLKDLADLQNGPPLEQHRKEWEETMDKVYKCLSEHGL